MNKVLEKQTYNQELTELTDKFLSIPTPKKRRETEKSRPCRSGKGSQRVEKPIFRHAAILRVSGLFSLSIRRLWMDKSGKRGIDSGVNQSIRKEKKIGEKQIKLSNKLSKIKLNPCPFCGSKVNFIRGFGGILFFECTNKKCGATVSFRCYYRDKTEIQKWNGSRQEKYTG